MEKYMIAMKIKMNMIIITMIEMNKLVILRKIKIYQYPKAN